MDIEEDVTEKAFRLIGMLNMALVASHIPSNTPAGDMSKYDTLIDLIKSQYREISGEGLPPDTLKDITRGIWIKLPHAAPVSPDKVSEYYRLTIIQLKQAA